ncbi:hypothetical protein [Aeromicrobium sp. NPDC092404]|uniref:hypothetical protein n=1 Tax=Aeromicrobium sp. NPDC092404 TaxID=3154976 RepID=UPI00341AEA3D
MTPPTQTMLKVLWPHQVRGILDSGLSSIGGPVVRAADLPLSDPADLLRTWGWEARHPYGDPPQMTDVLRFPMHPLMRTSTPSDSSGHHVPSFSRGFLPSTDAVVPVFDLALTRVPTGAELWRLRTGEAPALKLVYDGPAAGWRQAPSYFPPLHLVGPRARWNGEDLPAAFRADTSQIELVHVGDGPPPGFEPVRPTVSRRIVDVAECEAVFEAVLTGRVGELPVRVLQRAGDHSLVHVTGISTEVATDLGAVEVEPGRFELVTPSRTVTDLGGSTYELASS